MGSLEEKNIGDAECERIKDFFVNNINFKEYLGGYVGGYDIPSINHPQIQALIKIINDELKVKFGLKAIVELIDSELGYVTLTVKELVKL
jgi:hypothetical protein